MLCVWVPRWPLQALAAYAELTPQGAPEPLRRLDTQLDRQIEPRAVIETADPAPLVVVANEAAERFGVVAGLTSVQAEARCPQLQLHWRSQPAEYALEQRISALAEQTTPRRQPLAPGWWLLDLNGLERLRGSALKIAGEWREQMQALGVAATLGLAVEPVVAALAALACPRAGLCLVSPGEERVRMADWPLRLLQQLPADLRMGGVQPAMGRGKARSASGNEDLPAVLGVLRRWGLERLGQLGALPAVGLAERLGPLGLRLRALARGEDCGLLLLPRLRPEPPHCVLEFDPAEENYEALLARLEEVLLAAWRELERRERVLESMSLQLLSVPSPDWLAESGLDMEEQSRLQGTRKRYEHRWLTPPRRMRDLMAQLRLQIQGNPPVGAVARLEFGYSVGAPRKIQPRLFEQAAPDADKLPRVLARLASRLGDEKGDCIGVASTTNSHQPHTYRFTGWRDLGTGERRAPVGGAQHETTEVPGGGGLVLRTVTPGWRLRILEQHYRRSGLGFADRSTSMRAEVGGARLRPGMEMAIASGPEQGRRLGVVRHCAGPWRSSGQWWDQAAWACDEWDVEFDTGLLALLRWQGEWVLTGAYD